MSGTSRARPTCLALDFGGTIAAPGRSPRGADVAAVLRDNFRCDVPPGFEGVVDRARGEARTAYRRSGRQTPWEATLAAAAEHTGGPLLHISDVADALWDTVPDGAIGPAAAAAVQDLHRSGYVLVLACNTQRPLPHRRRTLADAGLLDCFSALVVSSDLGVGKPDPAFYAAVAEAGRRWAAVGPEGILFVGDSLGRDVVGPLRVGMRAVLVDPGHEAASVPADVPVIEGLTELPALLAGWA
jgi:putative hydrolase of the HAD superfamily